MPQTAGAVRDAASILGKGRLRHSGRVGIATNP